MCTMACESRRKKIDMMFLTIAFDVIGEKNEEDVLFHGVTAVVFLIGANVEKWVNIQWNENVSQQQNYANKTEIRFFALFMMRWGR